MSYWTKRHRINAAVENQIAELSDDSLLSATFNANVDRGEPCVCVPVCDDVENSIACDTKSYEADPVSHGDSAAVDSTEYDCDIYGDDRCGFSESDSDSEGESQGRSNIRSELAQWRIKHGITDSALSDDSDLLSILRPHHRELPKDPRTIQKASSASNIQIANIKAVSGGSYYHFGITPEVLLQLQNSHSLRMAAEESGALSMQLNVDGIPLFKSTNGQFWPVLGKIDKPFAGTPFVIGLYYGTAKPSDLNFLQDFCHDYGKLKESGITLPDSNTVLSFSISALICDAPARAFLKNIKGHTAYSSCERCTQVGVWKGKMTFPDLNAPSRTDQSFILIADKEHHRGVSPLADTRLGIGLVSEFVLDYMHLICLGVVRRLIWLWVSGPLKSGCRLSSHQTAELSIALVGLRSYMPREFARRPRSLLEWQRWKATEFRQLLIYTGPVVLRDKVSDAVYKNFLLLSAGISLLLDEGSDALLLDYAQQLLVAFVKHYIELYGTDMIVYNVHNVIHLADDAKKFGSLDKVSAFCFENFLGKLVKLVRKPSQPLQQVVGRLLERRTVCGDTSYDSAVHDTTVSGEHQTGHLPCGLGACLQYRRVIINGVCISTTRGNNCIILRNEIVVVCNIIKIEGDVLLIYQKFCFQDDFYCYPLQSSKLGIFQVSHLSNEKLVGRLSDFKRKMVLLPFGNTFVAIPLLNF